MYQSHEEDLSQLQSVYGKKDGKSVQLITNSVSQLYREWRIFLYFFAGEKERVDVLNRSSGSTTQVIQKALWDNVISKIRRLTDPSKQGRHKDRNENLSLERLVEIAIEIDGADLKGSYNSLKATFESCREYANKTVAHFDLPQAHGLAVLSVTIIEITTVINAIGEFVRQFHIETRDTDCILMPVGGASDEKQFLMHLHLGSQKAEALKAEHLAKAKRGELFERFEYEWPDWIFDKNNGDPYNPF